MERKTNFWQVQRFAWAACGLLLGASVLQSCKDDDVLTGQPSWLGNSIYERLQNDPDGNQYTNLLQLIDDLGQTEVLRHTGSKTLFAADDNAFADWFKTNTWGVRSYSQLSTAQKKLLLNNSMINNAYLIELMSNVSGTPPMEGMAMRRETSSSIYDSVAVMPVSAMPLTPAWEELRSRGKAVPILKDETSAPMIHFLPAFMKYYGITSSDLEILTNHQASNINEAWVNGKKVTDRDITCKNGYIQKVDGVIESSPNMAEILRQHPKMSLWSHLMDRFSAPYYNATATREYNRINNNEDSVFTLRYFSRRSVGGQENSKDPKGDPVSALLKFDPGWNHYMYNNTMDYDLHYDAGVLFVPTNEALDNWWNNEGQDLKDEYKVWDSIPDGTLAALLNVNMQEKFTETVPSKFANVLDEGSGVEMGFKPEDVDSCFMGCNGVVYMLNKVYIPAEYSAVSYPALAHASTMNVIYWGISGHEKTASEYNFLPYLLSMDSEYAMLLPNNNAMLNYVDPASYGLTNNVVSEEGDTSVVEAPTVIQFYYDKSKSQGSRVQAYRFNSNIDKDGNIELGQRVQASVAANVINKTMEDLINQLIIVMPDKSKTLEQWVDDGYRLFKTKGGSMLRVTKGADNNLVFEGGWQMEHNHKPLTATNRYPKTNGVSYQLDNQMPLASQKSLYLTLKEHRSDYSAFLNLLENDYCDLLTVKMNNKYNPADLSHGNKNLKLFDNYNYTVYVPTNAAIEELQQKKILPTWEELEFGDDDTIIDSIADAEGWYRQLNVTNENEKNVARDKIIKAMRSIVNDFIRYHVQDHSLAIGMMPEHGINDNNYESMKRNPETGRFYPLRANYDTNSLTVVDVMGNERHVVKTEGLYNNICREYWFEGSGNSARQYMCSDVVVHLIDGALYYDDYKPWRTVVTEALK